MAEDKEAKTFSSKKLGIRIEKPEIFKQPLLNRPVVTEPRLGLKYRSMLVMTYLLSISALLIVIVSNFG